MNFRFGEFEIDEKRRELRLRGREVLLQPLVFDLLAHLVRHRDRVVGKDEILETLWPDVTVGEGSLQRAVSLARTALRQGGREDAIRTFPRQGYRFVVEAEAVEVPPSPANPMPEALERGRRAYEHARWSEAFVEFSKADELDALGTPDLERWALAALCSGRPLQAIPPLERAVAAHGAAGDRRGAARAALQLAQILFERRDLAVAKGWHARAARLLEAIEESREHGLLECHAARFALAEGAIRIGLGSAEKALAIGHRLEDPDLEALGLLYMGHAVLALGDAERGVALIDEAAATVLSGQVTPWFGGLIYCGVIWACRNRGDWTRAAEWTDQFERWCAQHGMESVPGTCRLHRAEVLSFRGRLDEAEKEIAGACDELGELAPWAEGDAYRVLGDMHLLRGRFEEAERAFRRAHALGWDPQPGLATLHLERGENEAALQGLERALAEPNWVDLQQRGQLLAHLVYVAAVSGRLERARSALEELDSRPEWWSTTPFRASVARARAELLRAEGDRDEAAGQIRSAIRSWTEAGAPHAAAEARLRLAEWFLADEDRRAAELELAAAEAILGGFDAAHLAERWRGLRAGLS